MRIKLQTRVFQAHVIKLPVILNYNNNKYLESNENISVENMEMYRITIFTKGIPHLHTPTFA